MERIILEATSKTPEIILDSQTALLKFSGNCTMADSDEFFKPIIEWLEEYSKVENKESTILFDMEYFHMTTARTFLEIFQKLENCNNLNNHKFKICWLYNYGDIDMEEAGKEYANMVNVPFNVVAKN